MTDQYKELRLAARHEQHSTPWAKQAMQLLAEMDAVGAGGVSGKPLTKAGHEKIAENEKHVELMRGGQIVTPLSVSCFDIGYNHAMKKMESWGPWTGSFEAIPGELVELNGTPGLREWVELILMADDETKAILRAGLKEEIELMFSRSIEDSLEYGDWIEWKGGENPVPGFVVQVKLDNLHYSGPTKSSALRWDHTGSGDITSYRVVK